MSHNEHETTSNADNSSTETATSTNSTTNGQQNGQPQATESSVDDRNTQSDGQSISSASTGTTTATTTVDATAEADSEETEEEQGFALAPLQRLSSTLSDDRSVADLAPISRAYRHSYAVERTDGAVIGAIKVEPASMSMVDDIEPHVQKLASFLAQSTINKGMLVDVPRSVDYSRRWHTYEEHKEYLAEQDSWHAQLQADLAEEREKVSNLYEQTTTRRDHYIIVEVDEEEAAQALSTDADGAGDLPFLGSVINRGQVERLKDRDRLQSLMVDVLERRMDGLAKYIGQLDGISTRCLPATEYVQVIANHYRSDDVYRFNNFQSLVRRSPIPGANGDPEHEVSHYEDIEGISSLTTDEDELEHQLKTLVTPDEFDPEQNDAITIDRTRRSATIAITGWPEVPDLGFLEPLYQYSHPGVQLTVATHFERKPHKEAKRDAKNQENSLEAKLDGKLGTVFEEPLERKLQEAQEFTEAIEWSDFGVFNAGLYITLTAPAQPATDHDDLDVTDPLTEAIEDVKLLLKEECGFDSSVITHKHEAGWQTTAPVATNELGTNVTLLGDGLARQFPYRYRNLSEPGGVKLGVHEYLREPTVVNILDSDYRPNGSNGGLYGMTGSGKTTTVQEMIDGLKMNADANDEDLTIVMSTPLEDFKSICDAYDGEHIVVGGGDTSINVLDIKYVSPETLDVIGDVTPWKDMFDRVDGFLQAIYDLERLSDYGDKKAVWFTAIEHAFRQAGIDPDDPETFKKECPTLQDVFSILVEMVHDATPYTPEELQDDEQSVTDRENTARQIVNNDLNDFKNKRYEHFTQKTSIDLDAHDVIYLDLQRYEGETEGGGLMMEMLLSDLREQAKLSDGKAFFAIDEFHYMLDNPDAAQFFKRLHRHSRHWNLGVWLATQEYDDLFETTPDGEVGLTDTAQVIFNNQSMQIYHYSKTIDTERGKKLDLSHRSRQFISDAARGEKTDDYAQAVLVVDEAEYPLRVEMANTQNPRHFALYQHDPSDDGQDLKQYLEQYRDADGNDPCNWRWT
jgi:hypothetical protein